MPILTLADWRLDKNYIYLYNANETTVTVLHNRNYIFVIDSQKVHENNYRTFENPFSMHFDPLEMKQCIKKKSFIPDLLQ